MSVFLAALLGVSTVCAHSRINNIVIDNVQYTGFDANSPNSSEVLVAWSNTVVDDGWVNQESYNTPDIICHRDAENAKGYAAIEAGSNIDIQWNGWPESHKGPIMTYLAYCGSEQGSCETVDKEDLEFFVIDEEALIDPDGIPSEFATAPGIWSTDELIANNATRVVNIPQSIASGFYVLRHEIIALHFATDMRMSGPQHYPQCINLEITGGGDERPEGVPGMELYVLEDEDTPGEGENDQPGLVYDISSSPLPEYEMPGPTLFSGAETSVEQTSSVVTSTATATAGDPEVLKRMRARGYEVGEGHAELMRMGVKGVPTPAP